MAGQIDILVHRADVPAESVGERTGPSPDPFEFFDPWYVSAARLAGEAGPIEHYASARAINGRAGLHPSRYQSDEVDRTDGSLVRQCNRKLPSSKRDALTAVRTPDKTVWGHRDASRRASDIYQGGENEPTQADRAVPSAHNSVDNESEKLPSGSRAQSPSTRASNKAFPTMTVL